jgi:hypothetical protein
MTFPRPTTPASELRNAGGAYVRRRFTLGERAMIAGMVLTADEVADMPRANLNSLINIGTLELFPKGPLGEDAGEYFLVPIGARFIIVQGRRITDEALTRLQAETKLKELENR